VRARIAACAALLSLVVGGAFVMSAGSAGALASSLPGAGGAGSRSPLSASPIKHVVVLFQENHSFNDLLGRLCVDEGGRCVGSTTATLSDGSTRPLAQEGDVPPPVGHDQAVQTIAIDGGKMDGWDRMPDQTCSPAQHYACLMQVHAGAVPSLWSLADTYALSDMTFESGPASSWGSHLELVAATMDGFLGFQPGRFGEGGAGLRMPGTGCDSGLDARWMPSPTAEPVFVPSCIPDRKGRGPYRPSPVPYVPTIMDSLEAKGLSWNIFAPGTHGGTGYGWAICPTFYECLGSGQLTHVRSPTRFADVALAGKLPALSIVIPLDQDSQHNSRSLIQGDNWIAQSVQAVMDGPDWASTAIFVTYDDCGCFYDPVAPPRGYGIRVPMVIVSPYARPRFVDRGTASLTSMLAFTEHVFGLPPLGALDASAYDYANAFDFSQSPRPGIVLPIHRVPLSSLVFMANHPADPDDPT